MDNRRCVRCRVALDPREFLYCIVCAELNGRANVPTIRLLRPLRPATHLDGAIPVGVTK